MNVGNLKRLLADVPDDTEVVLPGPDHSYRRVRSAHLETAGSADRGRYLGEYHSDLSNGGGWDTPPDAVVKVLVVE